MRVPATALLPLPADPKCCTYSMNPRSARRLRDIEGVQLALESLGSAQNITLTHLARTKKILFVEGLNDYKIIRRFAKNTGFGELSSGNDVTAFESGGFSSWEKIKSFAWGVKNTIDAKMKLFAVYDRDYYCSDEIDDILSSLQSELTNAHIHRRKEIENYFLVVPVLERVLEKQIGVRNRRSGENIEIDKRVVDYLYEITEELKLEAQSQYIGKRIAYHQGRGKDGGTITHEAIKEFEELWRDINSRMEVAPGKVTLRSLRAKVQNDYNVNLSDVQIIDEFNLAEIPEDLRGLIDELEAFRAG
jgi:hypothetical protein